MFCEYQNNLIFKNNNINQKLKKKLNLKLKTEYQNR